MYLEHFALRELPFSITPDTGFFFNNASHQQAMNVLQVALHGGEGFIKITGEVGTGKTLLCRQLLSTLSDDDKFVTAYIPNPNLSPAGLYNALADELGLTCPNNLGQHRLLKLINERLIELTAEGKQVVLLIDEAQAMPEQSLEALRLLTNLETEKHKLLQIVLFGQPELDVMLERPSIRQLKQRIVFSYALSPMGHENIIAYLTHRLITAGYAGAPLFDSDAQKQLWLASRGIPRLVNILAHKSLMAAYGQGARHITRQHIQAAIEDTEDATKITSGQLKGWLAGIAGVLAVAALGAWFYMYSGYIK